MVDSPDIAADLIFAKTPLGQAEIQQRTLRLPLLTRRVLLLVDGRRAVSELLTLAGNADVAQLLSELEALGCVERSGVAEAPAASTSNDAAPAAAGSADDPLAGLPPPQTRSLEQVDMARHFMINTINRLLEQNSRLTLVEKIFNAVDAADLRTQYSAWEEAIGSTWQGKRRLPELREKLFAVL
jgi:hypothetical protein